MRKLAVNTFLTLDGVMQAPGGPEEDPSGGFTHGGWSFHYWDERMGQIMDESIRQPFDLLLGRMTYEIFAAHWPYAPNDPMADALNSAKKYVASRTLNTVEWQNSTLIKGDVGEEVAKLKGQDGPEIQVHGSGNLIQTLMKNDLIDEFGVWVFPVLLGAGKRLFADGTIPAGLRLARSEAFSSGVVFATYERAGEVKYGSFALEEPTEAEVERRQGLAGE
jgi:dihydrofolate reductase